MLIIPPNHVVFQFQNVPVTHYMNNAPNTNVGGYAGSNMKDYLVNNFLPGLKAATGLTDEMLWAPKRVVANGGSSATGAHTINTVGSQSVSGEMFGNNATLSSPSYETSTNQAWLEYYTDVTSLKKYISNNTGFKYWLASPYYGDAVSFGAIDNIGSISGDVAGDVHGCAPAFCVE